MPKLDIVGQIFHTTTTGEPVKIVKVYRGSDEVWPRRPVDFTLQSTKWDAVTVTVTPPAIGATSYVIKRDGVEVDRRTVANVTAEFTFTDTWPKSEILPSMEYEYTVEAYKAGGLLSTAKKSITSANRVAMTIDVQADKWYRATITWTDNEPNEVGKINQYEVYKDNVLASVVTLNEGKEKTVNGLDPNKTYKFCVKAMRRNSQGQMVPVAQTPDATKTTPVLSAPLTCTAVSSSQINLSWTDPGGLTGITVKNITAASTASLAGTATSYESKLLQANTKYSYQLDGQTGSKPWPNIGSNSATTHRAIKQSTKDCEVLWWGSYRLDGTALRPTNSDGSTISHCYYGEFSTTHRNQMSIVRFNIPNYIRGSGGCISVDAVQVKWYNQWHNLDSGGQVSMAGHHWVNRPSTYGGTGAMTHNGQQVVWPAPKPGWINNMGDKDPETGKQWEWYHVGFLRVAYTMNGTNVNRTINEEIYDNLQGLCLVRAYTGQNGYGYAATDPVLRITYTHYV